MVSIRHEQGQSLTTVDADKTNSGVVKNRVETEISAETKNCRFETSITDCFFFFFPLYLFSVSVNISLKQDMTTK